MPPPEKKLAVVFLFDLKIKNRQVAIRKFQEILATNRFSGSKDLCKIVILHSEQSEGDGHYKHISYCMKHESRFDPILVEDIINTPLAEDNGNWLYGLKVACHVMKDMTNGRDNEFVIRHIVFITDLSTQLPDEFNSEEFVPKLQNSILSTHSFLYIIGPGVNIVNTISYPNSNKWDLMGEEHLPDDMPTLKNITIAKKLIGDIPGVICNFDVAIDIYFFSKCFFPKKIQNNTLDLHGIQIPCVMYSQYLKRGPHITYKGFKRTYQIEWVNKHNVEEKIPNDNITEGLQLHGKFVPFTKDLDDSFKEKPEKTFRVLCFVQAEEVYEYLLGHESVSRVTCSEDYGSMFGTLVDTCLTKNVYVLVAYNYGKGFELKVEALIPQTDRTFIMVPLAFADDLKKFAQIATFEDLKDIDSDVVIKEEKNTIYNFLSANDVSKSSGPKLDLIHCIKSEPTNKLLNHRLLNKYLGKGDLEEDVPPIQTLLMGFDNIEDPVILNRVELDN